MNRKTKGRIAQFALCALATLAGCGRDGDPLNEAEGAEASGAVTGLLYAREYVFLASTAEGPLVVPFSFLAADTGDALDRTITGWLARGAAWDRFLEEESRTERSGGVWKVVPDGELRVLAGGATEVETLRFERGDRRLRLELGSPFTSWVQGGDARFRLLRGRLAVGSESLSGPILEMLHVDRTLADGWPEPQDYDELFLVGDSIQLVIGESMSEQTARQGFAWVRSGEAEQVWGDGEVRWVEVRSYQDARRDIPQRWSFRIPGAAVAGEVTAHGFDARVGPERGARRAVEVRYTVSGWVEVNGQRRDVTGTVRHTQT